MKNQLPEKKTKNERRTESNALCPFCCIRSRFLIAVLGYPLFCFGNSSEVHICHSVTVENKSFNLAFFQEVPAAVQQHPYVGDGNLTIIAERLIGILLLDLSELKIFKLQLIAYIHPEG